MKAMTIRGRLEKDGDSDWQYVHIPKQVREAYQPLERRGSIPVTATIGAHSWQGSLLPWADGSAQLSVGKNIRDKERLAAP